MDRDQKVLKSVYRFTINGLKDYTLTHWLDFKGMYLRDAKSVVHNLKVDREI